MAIPPGTEWVCKDDDDLAEALKRIMKLAGVSSEMVAKSVGSQTLNGYMRRENLSARTSSIFKAMESLGLEVVFRAPVKAKMQSRLEIARARKAQREAATVEPAEPVEAPTDEHRDETGRLKVLTPEVREQVDVLLGTYGSF